jgi:hypothetical protein
MWVVVYSCLHCDYCGGIHGKGDALVEWRANAWEGFDSQVRTGSGRDSHYEDALGNSPWEGVPWTSIDAQGDVPYRVTIIGSLSVSAG